jgi:ABC-type multidrug transport system fused ATPase/permease subunit
MARPRLNSGDSRAEDLPKPKISKALLRKAARLFSYLKPYRLKFLVGLTFLVLSSLTMLTLPALLGAMIDAAEGRQTYPWLTSSVFFIGLLALIILFVQSIFSFFRIRLFVEITEKTLAAIPLISLPTGG